MKRSIFRAWSAGATLLLMAFAIWFVFLQARRYSEVLIFLLWLSPLAAGFVSAYLAPSKKILVGASMALPFALLAVILNAAFQTLGHQVDFPGLRGGLILFATALVYGGILSGLGATGGYVLAKKVRNESSCRS